MGSNMTETVLGLFDTAKDKKKQVEEMAVMFGVTKEKIVEILRENGRLKEPGQPKATEAAEQEEPKEAPKEERKDVESPRLPMPDIVLEALSDKLRIIDEKIGAHDDAIAKLEKEFTTISDFIKNYK